MLGQSLCLVCKFVADTALPALGKQTVSLLQISMHPPKENLDLQEVGSVADPDPRSGVFLTPGSGKYPDPGSGMNIPFLIFWQ
jgi:hypothetical protein